jgi:hypothetical protein
VPTLTKEELAQLIAKLDDVCRQSQELQRHLRQMMVERARAYDRVGDPVRDEHLKPKAKPARKRR